MAMIVISVTVEEIRETYFYDALPTDELPMIHRAGLLLAPFDDSYEDLFFALHGWNCEPLRWNQTLWYSTDQLAAVVLISHEVYLFTFVDRSSLQAGLVEIRKIFSR
jgi:hypothetical protein